jgi:hypothetical protein
LLLLFLPELVVGSVHPLGACHVVGSADGLPAILAGVALYGTGEFLDRLSWALQPHTAAGCQQTGGQDGSMSHPSVQRGLHQETSETGKMVPAMRELLRTCGRKATPIWASPPSRRV